MKSFTSAAFEHVTPTLTLPDGAITRIDDLFCGSLNSLRFQPGQSIVVQGDKIEHLYQVVAGTVRCCSFTEEGRRQIFRFARAGDVLGFVDPERWHFSAEAVDCVVARSIPIARLEAALEQHSELRRDLRAYVARVLAERERQLSVLAFEPAAQRLLWFLKDFAKGRCGDGYLSLPMTRQEIGDFLGLSLETVSRSFSTLRQSGMIEMKGTDRFRVVEGRAALAA
ncbi:MAG: helix-turn-helix domain-containing protein [Pseudomonadota bacterium]